MEMLHTIVELEPFQKDAAKALTRREQEWVVWTLAGDPTKGVLLDGGIRKMRVAASGKGKSGGARVIYYFAGKRGKVFLLAVFAKNEKGNLTKSELKELGKLAKTLK